MLQALGEELDVFEYNDWMCHFPDPVGTFEMRIGTDNFNEVLHEAYGEEAVRLFRGLWVAASLSLPPRVLACWRTQRSL